MITDKGLGTAFQIHFLLGFSHSCRRSEYEVVKLSFKKNFNNRNFSCIYWMNDVNVTSLFHNRNCKIFCTRTHELQKLLFIIENKIKIKKIQSLFEMTVKPGLVIFHGQNVISGNETSINLQPILQIKTIKEFTKRTKQINIL